MVVVVGDARLQVVHYGHEHVDEVVQDVSQVAGFQEVLDLVAVKVGAEAMMTRRRRELRKDAISTFQWGEILTSFFSLVSRTNLHV